LINNRFGKLEAAAAATRAIGQRPYFFEAQALGREITDRINGDGIADA